MCTISDTPTPRNAERDGAMRHLSLHGRAALVYAGDLRWYVFALWPRGKEPRIPKSEGGKGYHDATIDPAQITTWWSRWPTANIGIALAASGLLVYDVDARSGGDATAAEHERRHGCRPETPTALSSPASYHEYYRRPAGVPLARVDYGAESGVDLLTDGYVAAPPSVHPLGHRYAWATGYGPRDLPLAEPPAWMLAPLRHRYAVDTVPTAALADTALVQAFAAAGRIRRVIDERRVAVTCPWVGEHTSDAGTSTVVFAAAAAAPAGWWYCAHAHCRQRTQREVWAAVRPRTVRVDVGL